MSDSNRDVRGRRAVSLPNPVQCHRQVNQLGCRSRDSRSQVSELALPNIDQGVRNLSYQLRAMRQQALQPFHNKTRFNRWEIAMLRQRLQKGLCRLVRDKFVRYTKIDRRSPANSQDSHPASA